MTKFIAFTALALSAATGTTAFAQEQGRVLSATPVIQQVAIPQQVCSNQMVYSQRQPSGAGALFGAVVGGLAGSAIGGGSGRAAATAIGMMGGSIVGNQVEAGPPGYRPMQTCGMQTTYQSQTVAYDVTYEYAGRRYTTRTQYDPGRWIPLSVQPMDQGGYQGYQGNQGGGYGNYGYGYGSDPRYQQPYPQQYQYQDQYPQQPQQQQYQQYPQPQASGGGYSDQGYYDQQAQAQAQAQAYPDNRYDNGSYPQRGVVVTGQTSGGVQTYPVDAGQVDQAGQLDYRNSRGEPYRP